MVSQDPLLSLFALMFVPVAAVGVRKIGIRVRKIMASEFRGAMQNMESLQETAQGIRIVKAFTLESFIRDRQARAIEGFQGAANKLARVSSRTSPMMESLGGFAIAPVVLYSGYPVIIRGNPPGSLFPSSLRSSCFASREPCLGIKVKAKRPAGCVASQVLVFLEMWAE